MISLQVTGVTGKRGGENASVSEKDLILNRAGYFELTRQQQEILTICPKHRKSLTADWQGRKSGACSYPAHLGKPKQLKSPRRINAHMSLEIYQIFNSVVPIGSGKRFLLFLLREYYFDWGQFDILLSHMIKHLLGIYYSLLVKSE